MAEPLLNVSRDAVEAFVDDVALLWCADIPILDSPPSPMVFLRDYVARSRPCLIRNSFPAASSLSLDDLVDAHAELQITVDVTPDGHGDCLRYVKLPTPDADDTTATKVLVQPAHETMTLSEFRRRLRSQSRTEGPSQRTIRHRVFALDADHGSSDTGTAPAPTSPHDDAIVYYSRQNDCLRTELAPLWNQHVIPHSLEWAESAFATSPEAVNLWMGNARSVSAMHKDPYENLYAVRTGHKVFTLCPPSDAPFLYEHPPRYRSGRFAHHRSHANGNGTSDPAPWTVQLDATVPLVPWVSAPVTCRDDDTDVDVTEFPLVSYAHARTVHVHAGDVLYLPALWYHAVTQTCETVAVNYWYPMVVESPLWCFSALVQHLRPVHLVNADGMTNQERSDSNPQADTSNDASARGVSAG